MEAKKENHKELDDLQAQVCTINNFAMHKSTLSIFSQLEDVQQAYTMDKIRFEEKYEDILGQYQSEETRKEDNMKLAIILVLLM